MITLTEKEWQIGKHLVEGNSNRQIGRKVGCAALTVKNHIYKMLRKASVLNRTQLAVVLATQNVIVENHNHRPSPLVHHGVVDGEPEYQSWFFSLPDNLCLTIKPQSAGEEEYISWYFLGPAKPVVCGSKAVGWIASHRNGAVYHFSALEGFDVQAVAFQDQLFPEEA